MNFRLLIPLLFWTIFLISGIYILIKAKKMPRNTDEETAAYTKKMKEARLSFLIAGINILLAFL